MTTYSIKNIISFRKLEWNLSDEFLYLTDIPEVFEPFDMKPNYYSYGLIRSGSMQIEVDSNKFHIGPSSLLVYRPEQTLKILDIQPGTKGAFVLFTKRFIDYLFESFFSIAPQSFLRNQFASHFTLSKYDHDKIVSQFGKVIDFLNDAAFTADRWAYSAKNMLLALINETDFVLDKYKPDTIESGSRELEIKSGFQHLVTASYTNHRSVGFYADKLNISPNYLHKIIKKHYRQTPLEMINHTLIVECKTLLADADRTIGEIAERMAFSGVQSFSKYFKKHTGKSPSLFRNSLLSANRPQMDNYSQVMDNRLEERYC